MALAWFIIPFKVETLRPNRRYCAVRDLQSSIDADGGTYAFSEVLGNVALVKVRASAATLTLIAGLANVDRIPHVNLNDTLGDLTAGQRNAILNRLQNMGYTLAEINNALGGTLAQWQTRTLGQLLNFICQRRREPRWDEVNEIIVLDGAQVVPETPAKIDAEVQ